MAPSGFARILKASGPRMLHRLLGVARCSLPLATTPLPVRDLGTPSVLGFFLGSEAGRPLTPAVKPGDDVSPGQPLARSGDDPRRPSPVRGTVKGVQEGPDIRADRPGLTVLIEPQAGASPQAFEPLDPDAAPREKLVERLREAGIRAGTLRLVPLAGLLDSPTLVVLAADREPGVSVTAHLLAERTPDVGRSLGLLGRAAGSARVILAAPAPSAGLAARACQGTGAGLVSLPPVYPQSLEPLVARRAGDSRAAVIGLETALAALDAVVAGRIQSCKLLTLLGTGRGPAQNLRVPLGMRLADLVAACDLEIHDLDKLVAGGPMQGFAQYSLDAVVDEGVDALVLTRAEDVVPFDGNPCINCGACIDVCPVHLQVQLIGRCSEFGKFDPIEHLGIDHCIECGLCATVCTGRRPLMQMIRLAKQRLLAARPEESAPGDDGHDAEESESG